MMCFTQAEKRAERERARGELVVLSEIPPPSLASGSSQVQSRGNLETIETELPAELGTRSERHVVTDDASVSLKTANEVMYEEGMEAVGEGADEEVDEGSYEAAKAKKDSEKKERKRLRAIRRAAKVRPWGCA
jgi:hypothetical protein